MYGVGWWSGKMGSYSLNNTATLVPVSLCGLSVGKVQVLEDISLTEHWNWSPFKNLHSILEGDSRGERGKRKLRPEPQLAQEGLCSYHE